MLIHATRPLFAWSELEGPPSLRTIRAVLSSLPDEQLLHGLQQAHGNGRNDSPVRGLWGTLALCRHVWLNDCLAELHRNPTGLSQSIRRLESGGVLPIAKLHDLAEWLYWVGSRTSRWAESGFREGAGYPLAPPRCHSSPGLDYRCPYRQEFRQ